MHAKKQYREVLNDIEPSDKLAEDLHSHTNETTQCRFSGNEVIQKAEEAETASTSTPNQTGMPGSLKTGLESLSGYDLSSVRVHYNSPKPRQIGALAYTQGTDVHIGPGQQKHLPHEGWHVVQQMQGRVKPTMQMKGSININDDAGLEKEADLMGKKAGSNNRFAPQKRTFKKKENNYRTSTNQNVSESKQSVIQRDISKALEYGIKGLAIGAGIGAAVGSIIPGLGTALGAGIGGTIGGLIGVIKGARTRTEAALVRAANAGFGAPWSGAWSCHMTVHNWLVEAGYASRNHFPANNPHDYQNAFYAGAVTPVRVGGNFTDTPGKIILMYDVATGNLMHSMVSLGAGHWKGHNNLGTFGSAAPFTGSVDVAALDPAWWNGPNNILFNQQADLGARPGARLRIVKMNPSGIGAAYQ